MTLTHHPVKHDHDLWQAVRQGDLPTLFGLIDLGFSASSLIPGETDQHITLLAAVAQAPSDEALAHLWHLTPRDLQISSLRHGGLVSIAARHGSVACLSRLLTWSDELQVSNDFWTKGHEGWWLLAHWLRQPHVAVHQTATTETERSMLDLFDRHQALVLPTRIVPTEEPFHELFHLAIQKSALGLLTRLLPAFRLQPLRPMFRSIPWTFALFSSVSTADVLQCLLEQGVDLDAMFDPAQILTFPMDDWRSFTLKQVKDPAFVDALDPFYGGTNFPPPSMDLLRANPACRVVLERHALRSSVALPTTSAAPSRARV